MQSGSLYVRIQSPVTDIGLDLHAKLPEFLEQVDYSMIENDVFDDSIDICFRSCRYDMSFQLEDFLDQYREKDKKIRYMINCYLPNERYPSLVRINKQLKKIRVKKKKRFMGL